eukprot:357556-Amphidinium_carterae.1
MRAPWHTLERFVPLNVQSPLDVRNNLGSSNDNADHKSLERHSHSLASSWELWVLPTALFALHGWESEMSRTETQLILTYTPGGRRHAQRAAIRSESSQRAGRAQGPVRHSRQAIRTELSMTVPQQLNVLAPPIVGLLPP